MPAKQGAALEGLCSIVPQVPKSDCQAQNMLPLVPIGTVAALLIAYPIVYHLATKTDPKLKKPC